LKVRPVGHRQHRPSFPSASARGRRPGLGRPRCRREITPERVARQLASPGRESPGCYPCIVSGACAHRVSILCRLRAATSCRVALMSASFHEREFG
jgi:hypothetical protein